MNTGISCKFEKFTYNTLASRRETRNTVAAYSYVIHSIHRMLSSGYNKLRVGSLWALKIVKMSINFEFAIYEKKHLGF